MLQMTSEKKSNSATKSRGPVPLGHGSVKASSALLKAAANENRLMMLNLLRDGEKSVQELGKALKLRQPTVSQHLARLREDDMVKTRRQGQTIYYSLANTKVRRLIDLLRRMHAA